MRPAPAIVAGVMRASWQRSRALLWLGTAIALRTGAAADLEPRGPSAPPRVTLADLVSSPSPGAAEVVTVAGRTAPGDGGGGILAWIPNDTTATNLGTVFAGPAASGRWRRQFSGPLDIRWFGAVADGVSDSGPAIQDAISIVPSQYPSGLGGGEVYVPPAESPGGSYLLRTPLLITNSHLRLFGSGWGSRLLCSTRTHAPFMTVANQNSSNGVQGATIERLFIWSEAGSDCAGVWIAGGIGDPVILRDCVLRGFSTNLSIGGGGWLTFVSVSNCKLYNAYMTNNFGVFAQRAGGLHFWACDFQGSFATTNNTHVGAYLDYCQNVVFDQCLISWHGGGNLVFTNCENAAIKQCYMETAKGADCTGIRLLGGNKNTHIIDNFEQGSPAPHSKYGITVADGNTHTVISGNVYFMHTLGFIENLCTAANELVVAHNQASSWGGPLLSREQGVGFLVDQYGRTAVDRLEVRTAAAARSFRVTNAASVGSLSVSSGAHIGGSNDPGAGNLLAEGTIQAAGGFRSLEGVPGLSATLDVLDAGGRTNRLVFRGGILVSNLADFHP